MGRFLKKLMLLTIVLLIGIGLWQVVTTWVARDGYTVVLDPGHGGSSPGAVYDGVMEKDLNLAVAERVQQLLTQEADIRVVMTREADVDVGLYERADCANEEHADLFVSIHSNALENNTTYEGIITFFHNDNHGGSTLAALVEQCVSGETGGINLGTRAEDYVVIRETTAPACLLEMGFMTSPVELGRLQSPDYQEKIARGVVNGILAYQAQVT